jgi:type IV pilus assembly protein PilX
VNGAQRPDSAAQRGIVLVTSLLLLVVVTIIALTLFRSFGLEERIAGNVRDKQRALHAAETAQQFGEWWLANNATSSGAVCNGLLDASPANPIGQVCSNTLPAIAVNNNVANLPWQVGGVDVGVTYTPPGMVVSAVGGLGTYIALPRVYVSFIGPSATGAGNIYQVDAVGYGGNANAVAVVESTYLVTNGVRNLGEL